MAEYYEYNREHDMSDWKFTRWQRHQIVLAFSEDTANVSKSRRELFKRIIDEECEKGNALAMRIKGYGCYGEDKVFECDWEESRRLITKLFCNGDVTIFKIKNADYILQRSDFEKK